MVLLQINFDFPIEMMGENLTKNALSLAENINDEEGFISKLWIENVRTGKSGGIYIFDDLQHAHDYAAMHSVRVQEMGATNLSCEYFDVNETLSRVNNGI